MGLGKYRILERLRTTHNAVVYKARDAMLDRLVTVKQMTPDLIDDPIACGHFKREAQILARIRTGHSHIISIHELIEDDLGLFIVEEYVPGDWLESLIAKRRLDLHGAIRILKTAALGLRTLHALGTVHRGVHPRNILVARDGIAKITNLGTAARESDTTPPPVITPKYAAPEFLTGIEYDDRIDIYALGILLFEMCVGRPAMNRHFADIVSKPKTADAAWSAWHTDFRAELPLASELNPVVPPELATLIRQMTAKDLDHRLSSIQDVLLALSPRSAGRIGAPTTASAAVPPLIHPKRRRSITPGSPDSRLLESRPVPASPTVSDNAPKSVPPMRTRTVRLVASADPQPAPLPTEPAAPSPSSPLPLSTRARSQRRRVALHRPTIAPMPPRIQSVPMPDEVSETHKVHRSRLATWLTAAAVLIAALGFGGRAMWVRYSDDAGLHPIQAAVSEGNAALERGAFEEAARKLREAAAMDVDRPALLEARDRAVTLLLLVQGWQALAANEFETAEDRLDEAERRGADQLAVDDLQHRIWSKKDAYRLIDASAEDRRHGHYAAAELRADEYERTAAAAGLDPTLLRNELRRSKEDRKYAAALKRADNAIEVSDFENALAAWRDAEQIRITTETRQLQRRILDLQKRSDAILRGDDAMLKRDFARAAEAYQKANEIQATEDIEVKVRLANALVLYEEAMEAYAEGNLLIAERRLRSSLWQSNIEMARMKLNALAPAFEANSGLRWL